MKKHQALQAELAGHEPRINNVSQLGAEMVNDGHFAADEIQGRLKELEDRWKSLKVLLDYLHLCNVFSWIYSLWT